MAYSKKLLRQFTKCLDTTDVLARLAEIQRIVENVVDPAQAYTVMLAGFPEFFASVDRSYEDYETQVSRAVTNLEKSSSELNALNGQLETLNLTISAMLDALRQGLFSFGPDGICHAAYSRACLTLLECEPAGKEIGDVLRKEGDAKAVIQDVVQMLFSKDQYCVDYEELFALLPNRFIHSADRSITVEYRPIESADGRLRSILVVASDKTDEVQARLLGQEREQRAAMILRIANNRNIFTDLYRSIYDAFAQPQADLAPRSSAEQRKRDIHTFKGNAAHFHLTKLVSRLHQLETQLSGVQDREDIDRLIDDARPGMIEALQEARGFAEELLGRDFDRLGSIQTIPTTILSDMLAELRQCPDAQPIAEKYVAQLIGVPIFSALSLFAANLQENADRTGVRVAPCGFEGDNFLIYHDAYANLIASSTHISRNIVAHAGEPEAARLEKRKPKHLNVVVRTTQYDYQSRKWFRLEFCDDGRGVDIDALRTKCRGRRGGPDAKTIDDDAKMLQSIFDDDMSTTQNADQLSGRGVGLSALRYEAQALGGTAYVESKLGEFTKIIVEVPLIWP